ncbi:MAG: SPFH domain-containing protein [Phycisphaerales bacterium]|nr:MAG: SPFH domain-containing protein [Phycisphaerales bacterium]
MDIWKKLSAELIDIVEWLDSSQDTLVYRFERYQNEIKYGAKLVVREGQAAVFVNEGAIADVFQPGTYTLETRNLPILATLKGWKYGFNSPFKAEVYFVSTRQFTDLKWGTMNPIMLRDAEFGPVRLRAFGTYAVKATDPAALIKEIVGTNGHFTIEGLQEQLRNLIVSRFTDILGESKIPVLDLAANLNELGQFLAKAVEPTFKTYGISVPTVLVENISLPPAVEEALDKRTSMGVIGNLNAYTQFQAAEAMRDAAKNPSGTAGAGMGMGMGFAMANQMAQSMTPNAGAAGGGASSVGTPPPIPGAAAMFFVAVGQTQTGPFDLQSLASKVRAGELTRETLVWKQGMAQWTRADAVAEFAPIFEASPPPIPPR